MSKVIDEILSIYPSLTKVRVVVNSCSEPARRLALELFDQGATLIVSDGDKANVSALNKVIFERPQSLFRYRQLSSDSVHLEPCEVFVELVKEEKEVNAKHRISRVPKEKPIQPTNPVGGSNGGPDTGEKQETQSESQTS